MFLLAQAIISAGRGDFSGSTHHNCPAVSYYAHAFSPQNWHETQAREIVGQTEKCTQVLPLIASLLSVQAAIN